MGKAAGDNEFAPLEVRLSRLGKPLNTVSRCEHVQEIALHICAITEKYRSMYNALPTEDAVQDNRGDGLPDDSLDPCISRTLCSIGHATSAQNLHRCSYRRD